MGMTIEDCISKVTEILEEVTEDENAVCYVTDVDESTLKTAIDTMRKYQKIREIAFPLQFCSTDKLEHEAIMKICEVIENGNDE